MQKLILSLGLSLLFPQILAAQSNVVVQACPSGTQPYIQTRDALEQVHQPICQNLQTGALNLQQVVGGGCNGVTVICADTEPGADFAAKVNNAIAALPAAGGTVDARGVGGAQSMGSSIGLGSDAKPVKLLLPAGTITRVAGAQFVYFNGSWVEGQGNCNGGYYSNCTIINGPATADTAFAYGGSNQPGYVHLKGFYLHQTASAAVGVDFTAAIKSTIDDVTDLSDAGTALVVGGTGACACYNEFRGNDFRGSYGVKLLDTANQNVFYGGTIWGGTEAVHIRPDNAGAAPGANKFFGVDTENSGVAYHLYTGNNTIIDPYIEAVTSPFILESAVMGNWIEGSGVSFGAVTDNSGNLTNFYMGFDWTNGTTGLFPNQLAFATKMLIGGDSWGRAPTHQLYSLQQHFALGDWHNYYSDLSFNYEGQPNSYGIYGSAGLALSHAGITDLNANNLVTTAVGQPAAPTLSCTNQGSGTSYTYYLVAHTRNGVTVPSAAATIQCPNAPSSSFPITITPTAAALNNVYDWDVLKTDTAHSLCLATVFGSNAANCRDTGQGTGAYTAPARDSTGDATMNGYVNFAGGTAAASNCGSLTGAAGCIKVLIGGVLHYVPYW